MKIFTSIWMVVIVAAVLLGVRIDNNDYIKLIKYKTWDSFQKIHPRQVISDSVTIINITESDLKKYGQWPWPRHVMAMIHTKLLESNASVINYNVLFAEEDRLSGVNYLNTMPMDNELRTELGKVLLDTDAVFKSVLSGSNTVLMMSVKNTTDPNLPSTTPIIKKGNVMPWIYEYNGIVSPTGKISAGAKGMGVNVTSPEPDSAVRKVPLIVSVKGKLYPSMLIENLRLIYNSQRIKITGNEKGIQSVLVNKDTGIPVNLHAEMYIHYADPGKFVQMSIDELMSKEFNENKIKNRIIVVGLDAAGLSNLKYTPTGLATDQMISAQALDNLVTEKFLLRYADAEIYEIIFVGLLGLLMIILVPRVSVILSVPLLFFVLGGISYGSFMAYANKGWLVDPSFAFIFISIIWAHSTFNNFAVQSRLRKQIKKQFEHYLDPGMVKKLQKDPSLLKLGGETKEMTFLFSDIRGFTPISEKYKGNPEGLTKLINRFLTRMTDVIISNGGTIDKFMGDCIMAFWNAPIENKKHRQLAIKSALEMQDALKTLNSKLAEEGLPSINIGIGVNTGEALVGNMGSEQRFDYSVIGDAVNLASRLESSSKTLGKTLVVGEETTRTIETDYPFKFIDSITVKGKSEKIKVYTIE